MLQICFLSGVQAFKAGSVPAGCMATITMSFASKAAVDHVAVTVLCAPVLCQVSVLHTPAASSLLAHLLSSGNGCLTVCTALPLEGLLNL